MNNKKILILNDYHHTSIGGVQKYTKQLIEIFVNHGHCVLEASMHPLIECNNHISFDNYKYISYSPVYPKDYSKKRIYILKMIKLFFPNFAWRKKIKKIIKKEKVDVVIDNTFFSLIPFVKNVKYICVQHTNLDFYKSNLWERMRKNKFTKFIRRILVIILGIKEKFTFPNIVVFSQLDRELLIDYIKNRNIKKIPRIYNVALCSDSKEKMINSKNSINNRMPTEIVFVGRLENRSKNIAFLKEIAECAANKKINLSIDVYGDGEDKYLIDNTQGINIHGFFNPKDVDSILKNAKVLLLPSFYEGFPLSIVEALSHGVPCITSNNYLNALFLIDNSRGKVINSFDAGEWVYEISRICNLSEDKYLEMQNNAIKFAINHLSKNDFRRKWLEIVR